MNTFLLITTLVLACVVIVLLVLYIRAKKLLKDDVDLLRESHELNQGLMRTLNELNAENERLQMQLKNKKDQK